jgi:hypothetical protein
VISAIAAGTALATSLALVPQSWAQAASDLPPPLPRRIELRLPFRAHLRSRRSLVVGVTHVRPYRERDGDSGIWGTEPPLVYPHVGTSLQWGLGSNADFRLDTQLVIQFNSAIIPVVPRAVGAIVWHLAPGGSR